MVSKNIDSVMPRLTYNKSSRRLKGRSASECISLSDDYVKPNPNKLLRFGSLQDIYSDALLAGNSKPLRLTNNYDRANMFSNAIEGNIYFQNMRTKQSRQQRRQTFDYSTKINGSRSRKLPLLDLKSPSSKSLDLTIGKDFKFPRITDDVTNMIKNNYYSTNSIAEVEQNGINLNVDASSEFRKVIEDFYELQLQ